jgi:hypothetical protein
MTSANRTVETSGWNAFAGVLLIVAGTFNFIDGLVALTNAKYFENVVNGGGDLPITDNVQNWGWVVLIVGVVLASAGVALFSGALWARAVAVVAVGVNMVVQFAYLAHFPFWSLTMIALDIMIIYGLVVYGGRDERAV